MYLVHYITVHLFIYDFYLSKVDYKRGDTVTNFQLSDISGKYDPKICRVDFED